MNHYNISMTNSTLSNEDYSYIKSIAKKFNISTVKDYGNFCHEYNIEKMYMYLHNEYKSEEWISWSHFLTDQVYTFEESKNFFKNNKQLKDKIIDVESWFNFYNNVIYCELNNKHHDLMNDELINQIMKIPNQPKKFYKGEFVSWDDFLDLNKNVLNVSTINHINCGNDSKETLRILVNCDHKKIKNYKYGDYNDYEIDESMTSEIVDYLRKKINIKSELYLDCQVKLNPNGKFHNMRIDCKTNLNSQIPILIIFPVNKSVQYNIANNNSNNANKNDEYISDAKIVKILDDIINGSKNDIEKFKKQLKN
jgi:hypothetical protein